MVEEAISATKHSSRGHRNSNSNNNNSKVLWAKVLNYLEINSTTDGAIENPEFESPLPPYSVPSEILDEQLLERKFGPRQDNTILKLAVTAAPAHVVAALCHLQPHAARIADHRGKLPLHVACRRNPNDPDALKIFDILLVVYDEALAHRDMAGRTPLHCLFMYNHAPHRSVDIVKIFCQELSPKLIGSLKQPAPHINTNNSAGDASNAHPSSPSSAGGSNENFPLPEVPNPSSKDKVPSCAVIIPDARHGALPLHYAVMEGASRDVLRFLLDMYPESKVLVDRRGRSALAWYLGAGYGVGPTKTTTAGNKSNIPTKQLVTGEPTDPHTASWWDKNKVESATVQLLLTSKSARMADCTGRSPLHWAICTLARYHYHLQQPPSFEQYSGSMPPPHHRCPSISMKTFHLLLDHYTEGLVTGDLQEKTPLHLLFDAIKEVQEQDCERLLRNKTERTDLDLTHGGRKTSAAASVSGAVSVSSRRSVGTEHGFARVLTGNFSPPLDLLEILISASTTGVNNIGMGSGSSVVGGGDAASVNAASGMHLDEKSPVFMEDMDGRLPIHCAMEVASSPEVIKMLIKAHPTSLVHTTEERQVSPLHAALLSPYVAPLQTPETMRLVLQAYVASRHGTYVDGRLALKMEDADGNYPIHYACKNQVCLDVLQMFVEEYPKCALYQTPEGNLPLHSLLDEHVFAGHPDGMPPIGASLATSNTWSSPKEEEFHKEKLRVSQEKIRLLIDPILASNRVLDLLKTPSFTHGMLPLHIVVAWGAVPYTTVRRMLEKCPAAAEQRTKIEGHQYSPLDLHERHKANVMEMTNSNSQLSKEMDDDWQRIRELLFSFSPLLEGHRQLNDILLQSVRVVRSELGFTLSTPSNGAGERSYHWTIEQGLKNEPEVAPIEMAETFTSIEVPDIDHGGRPLSKKAIERSRQPAATPKQKKPKKNSSKRSTNKSKGSNRAVSHSRTDLSKQTKKSIYDDDALGTGYVISDGEEDDNDELEDDYFSGPESAEEYLSDESDERFDSFDDDHEGGDPTATTAEASWDNSVPANHPATSDSAARKDKGSPQEEKKEDWLRPSHSDEADLTRSCGPHFSEVGMRLLTFFMLYCDEKNPADNYASLVEEILDEVSRIVVEQVVSLPLPAYASQYLEEGARITGLTLRDVASPKCRELVHKLFYFLGRFDFRSETGGILLDRSSDSSTVQVRSSEWIFSTEEYNEAPEIEPGVAEAQVWETGVIPPEEVGYMGATFKAMRRSICFLFTKNAHAYHNEIKSRESLGVSVDRGLYSESHIVPLIGHFDATGLDRRDDRMYKNDTNNESFITLDIFGKRGGLSAGESICLADYPYALVVPYSNYGDLFDYFFRHGVEGVDDTREICSQIGKALASMHEKGIIHGNVSMRNIVLFPPMDEAEAEEGRKHWALKNLSGACRLRDSNSYMGKVSAQGFEEFYSSSLPPEMFVKLTQEELKQYKEYWDTVEKEFGATINRSVVDPVVDFHTGASYVMRCHFVPDEAQAGHANQKLPPLPYKLYPARESADIWAFGQLLFMLCSTGRPLFPTNARTGRLLNYKEICEWDMQSAEAMIYEFVDNPLAQDILLRLLAPYEKRASLTMETILSHPFFTDTNLTTPVARAVVQKRQHAGVAYRRWLENSVSEKSEEGWLKERTVSVACWDFDFQRRIHLTPTALIPKFLSRSVDHLAMPCSFVVLPYKLVRNKKGVLTPPSKRDVERAERLGHRMLALSKACQFVNTMKRVVAETEQPRIWSSTLILELMDLPEEDFSDLQSKVFQLASNSVEEFRSDPVRVALKLIRDKINEFLACYDDASKVMLYLVDELKGVPVVSPASAPFPCVVQPNVRAEVARSSLPFMYLCARYFRAVSGGVPGFVKLIFEAASPHVPPSWQPVCKGLDSSLEYQSIVDDMRILCDALDSFSQSSIDDNLYYMQKFLSEVDPRRMYANLQRVSSGEGSVWTGQEGVKEIQESAKGYGFKEAIDAKVKTDETLKAQQSRIETLEAELEKLKFHQRLDLHVPEVPEMTPKAASPICATPSKPSQAFDFTPNAASPICATPPRATPSKPSQASDLYERGMNCIVANSDLIVAKADESQNVKVEEATTSAKDEARATLSIEDTVTIAHAASVEVGLKTTEDQPRAKQPMWANRGNGEASSNESQHVEPAADKTMVDSSSDLQGGAKVEKSTETTPAPNSDLDPADNMEDESPQLEEDDQPPPTSEVEQEASQINEKDTFDYEAEDARNMLDNMFKEADLVFSRGPLHERPQNSAETPRSTAQVNEKSSPSQTRETREEESHDASTISTDSAQKGGVNDNASFLEITHHELLELKQTISAGRAGKESRGETFSEIFQKEVNSLHNDLNSIGKDVEKSPKRTIGRALSPTALSPTSSQPTSPRNSSREPSEVVSSTEGGGSAAGSVRRLTNFFLKGNSTPASPERPKLSNPQAKLRRTALESSSGEP